MQLQNQDDLTVIEIPDDLEWVNEFGWSPVKQDISYTIGGTLVDQQSKVLAGRPINLAGGPSVWAPRSLIVALKMWVDTPGIIMRLTMPDGIRHKVIFHHVEQALTATPLWRQTVQAGTNEYNNIQLNLITVERLKPVANAGIDQNVQEGILVNLDGVLSTDSDGIIVNYNWVQTSGAAVSLSDSAISQPTFTAPLVDVGGDTLTFDLVVTDDDNLVSIADTVSIVIDDTVPILYMPLVSDLSLVNGTGAATLTRSTIGTLINKTTGNLDTAAIDVARFEANGILIEGGSTNLIIKNTEYDTSSWGKVGATVTPNDLIAPDGTLTADKIDFGGGTGLVLQDISLTTTDNTGAVWVNGIVGETLKIEVRANNSSVVQQQQVTLTGGWERIDNSLVSADWSLQTDSTVRITIRKDAPNTADVFHLWIGQLETLMFSSSSILTDTIPVSRTADNLSIPTAGNFNESEGTISIEAEVIGSTGSSQNIFHISDGTNPNRIQLLRSNGKFRIIIVNGGVTQVDITTTVDMVPFTNYKLALVYKDNDVELFVNGASEAVDTAVTLPTSLTILRVGTENSSGNELFGHAKNLRTYNVKLTPLQVSEL
jgi:hypothetical protein